MLGSVCIVAVIVLFNLTCSIQSTSAFSAYSPSIGSALIGKPYYFDFHYSGVNPIHYRWYKNGVRFTGEPGRVIADHRGIKFTRVFQKDSGLYHVKSFTSYYNIGLASGSANLRVVYWWQNGTESQNATSDNKEISANVANAIANNITEEGCKQQDKNFVVSFVDSSADALNLMKYLRKKVICKQQENTKRHRKDRSHDRSHNRHRTNTNRNSVSRLVDADDCPDLDIMDCAKPAMDFNCKDHKVKKYRTINGTCNNLIYPLNGAADMPFGRLLPASYEDGISQPNGHMQTISGNAFSGPWPSPRYISWNIFKDLQQNTLSKTSHMFMVWGQFIDHDLDFAPTENITCDCNRSSKCIPIPVSGNDTFFGDATPHMGECLTFIRSIPICLPNQTSIATGGRNQINKLTSFIDASTVYGSDDKSAAGLRLGVGGLLKEGGRSNSEKGNLPFRAQKKGDTHLFEAGDTRVNEVVGLTIMHTIWMREHNRIARKLGKMNACWNDERIYQETRNILAAMNQVITYNEYLPLLFGSSYVDYVPPYSHYNPYIDTSIPNEFATAAFRFGHSTIRRSFLRLNESYLPIEDGPLPLENAFKQPVEYFRSGGTDPILRGLLVDHSGETDEFINSIITSKLFPTNPEKLGMDLASLNIQRGRDNGIAPYRDWQKFCEALFPGRTASFDNPSTERKLKAVYGEEAFKMGMDLWVGGLAEARIPGAQVGPTFACIIGLTFARVRDGDRFWYQNPSAYKFNQRRELEKVTLSKVICNNADNIGEIQKNAFNTDEFQFPCDSLNDMNLLVWKDRRC